MPPTDYSGFFRAIVIDNYDSEMFGKVKVFIPDIMDPDIVDHSKGLWAFSANNPMGGRSTDNPGANYSGTSYVPRKGSWVWVFFESKNPNRPYYFGAIDIAASKILPECQLGSQPWNKWVIFKSQDGRCIVVSDDPLDERIEITGKKSKITDPPAGDINSVYTIDDNQTTILFDERDGMEKILIRTYKGDFFNINIQTRELHAQFEGDIRIYTKGDFYLQSAKDMNIKCAGNLKVLGSTSTSIISDGGDLDLQGSNVNTSSGGNIVLDGGNVGINGGTVVLTGGPVSLGENIVGDVDHRLVAPAGASLGKIPTTSSAVSPDDAEPVGDRD